jgi:hypothetical protein
MGAKAAGVLLGAGMAVAVGRGMADALGVTVGLGVGEGVRVGPSVGSGVTVGGTVGMGVTVGAGMGVSVAVAVIEGVMVVVAVGVADGDAVTVRLLVALGVNVRLGVTLGVTDGVRDGAGVALARGVCVADGSKATTVGVCVKVGVPDGWRIGVWLGGREGAIVGVACGIVRLHASVKSAPNASQSAAQRRIANPPDFMRTIIERRASLHWARLRRLPDTAGAGSVVTRAAESVIDVVVFGRVVVAERCCEERFIFAVISTATNDTVVAFGVHSGLASIYMIVWVR